MFGKEENPEEVPYSEEQIAEIIKAQKEGRLNELEISNDHQFYTKISNLKLHASLHSLDT